jgi:hypothetical protein
MPAKGYAVQHDPIASCRRWGESAEASGPTIYDHLHGGHQVELPSLFQEYHAGKKSETIGKSVDQWTSSLLIKDLKSDDQWTSNGKIIAVISR